MNEAPPDINIYWCFNCRKQYGVIIYAFDNERCPMCGKIGEIYVEPKEN